MNLSELEKVCKSAREQGLDDNSEVKFYDQNSMSMCDTIRPLDGYQVRKVQQYKDDGASYRNKFLLLSIADLSHLSDR